MYDVTICTIANSGKALYLLIKIQGFLSMAQFCSKKGMVSPHTDTKTRHCILTVCILMLHTVCAALVCTALIGKRSSWFKQVIVFLELGFNSSDLKALGSTV